MELRKLEAQQLWQQGLIKEYQSGLTDIIRTYLMERYSINAPEMTTDEVMRSLTNALFDKKYNQELINILQIADLVKFAKATLKKTSMIHLCKRQYPLLKILKKPGKQEKKYDPISDKSAFCITLVAIGFDHSSAIDLAAVFFRKVLSHS